MKSLKITQAKPNPTGKDKTKNGTATATQLAAEWIDVKNTGTAPVSLTGVDVYHTKFDANGKEEKDPEKVCSLAAISLPAGHVLRVHSGTGPDKSVISAADKDGANEHMFTGRGNYVWNNKEGDQPKLWDTVAKEWVDHTYYDPNPPEGKILVRVGPKLQ